MDKKLGPRGFAFGDDGFYDYDSEERKARAAFRERLDACYRRDMEYAHRTYTNTGDYSYVEKVQDEYHKDLKEYQYKNPYKKDGQYLDVDRLYPDHIPTEIQQKETSGMNYSTAVMLINQNIRAINVIYDKEQVDSNGRIVGNKQQRYTYKTLDATIKKGDYVVVPTDTRHNLTVVLVDEVDVDVDFEAHIEFKWVVEKVSMDSYNGVLKEEGAWIEALKVSEKRRKREEIAKNMTDTYGADLKNLPIANMSQSAGTAPQLLAPEKKTKK